jgi:hypothetical protein
MADITISFQFNGFVYYALPPDLWFFSTRPILKPVFGNGGSTASGYELYRPSAYFGTSDTPNGCSFTVSNLTQTNLNRQFSVVATFPDSAFDLPLFQVDDDANLPEGNISGTAHTARIFIAWVRNQSDGPGKGTYGMAYQWLLQCPRLYPSDYVTQVLDGRTVLQRTFDIGTQQYVVSASERYEGDDIIFRKDTVSSRRPYRAQRPAFSYFAPPGQAGAGGNSSTLTSPSSSPTVSQFEFDWGNGDAVQVAATNASLVSFTDGQAHPLAAEVTRSRLQMVQPTVRARDGWGHLGNKINIALFPKADLTGSDNPEWNASNSFGRGTALSAWDWTFPGGLSATGETVTQDVGTDGTVRLYVTDANGRSDYVDLAIEVGGRLGLCVDENGIIYTTQKSGNNLQVYRYVTNAGSQELVATLANHKDGSLFQNGRPGAGGPLYLCAFDSSASTWRLRKSDNFGETWTIVSAPLNSNYVGVDMIGTMEEIMIAAGVHKTNNTIDVFLSFDQGANWTAAGNAGTLSTSPKAVSLSQKNASGDSRIVLIAPGILKYSDKLAESGSWNNL